MTTTRTTVTFDPDVAVRLARLRKKRDMGLKEIINEAIRRGLDELEAPQKPRKRFFTHPVDLGEPLIKNMDNIGEVLAMIEGEDYK